MGEGLARSNKLINILRLSSFMLGEQKRCRKQNTQIYTMSTKQMNIEETGETITLGFFQQQCGTNDVRHKGSTVHEKSQRAI